MGAVRPNINFSSVEPKLEQGRSSLADPVEFEVPELVIPSVSEVPDKESKEREGPVWEEYYLNLGIGDLLSEEALQNFNDFLKKIEEVIKKLRVVLKILRLFSSDLLNVTRALKFAIKQIVKTLQDFVDTFISTGIYTCVIRPDNSERDGTYLIPTWGGFDEFKRKVAAACLDRKNPASPARLTEGNNVGGFIIGGIAGINDPTIVDSMATNMSLLSDLFGFTGSMPAPPKNVISRSGYFNKILDGTAQKQLGIRITWNRPDSKGVIGYRVFRCRLKEGLPFTEEQRNEAILLHPIARNESFVRDIENARIYRDDDFEPEFVLGGISRDSYQFTDYEVEEGTTYFYSVMSVIKADGLVDRDPWNRRVGSPLMSASVGTEAFFCIPVSEIDDLILSLEGDFISPKEDYRFKWRSVTLRTYFGPIFDFLLDKVEQFSEGMAGLVQTSSDAMQDYIDFISKRISNYIKIIQIVTNIVTTLVSFRLRGSLLLLNLDPEEGGIRGFVDRVLSSQVESQQISSIEANAGNNSSVGKSVIDERRAQQDGGAKLSSIRGIYFGLVTVYGFPQDPSQEEFYDNFTEPYVEEYNAVQSNLENSQRAVQTLLKILLGE